jgi:hypothetical protein
MRDRVLMRNIDKVGKKLDRGSGNIEEIQKVGN